MALIWFKADIDSVIDGMTDFEWPCPAPRHLALIEMQAIIAAGKLDKWSHDRFSRRFKRPVSWCRVLRQAALSQEISRRHADDSQVARSNDADDKQGRSDNTAISEASVSRSQAGDTQTVSSSNASEQHPSCARASSRSKILEETENKTKTETEEKTPQPPKGATRDDSSPTLFDAPQKRTTRRAPRPPMNEATTSALAKPEKPPMPPHLELSPLAGLFRGLWYGTECVLTDGPNATLFSACAAAISAWQAEHGGSVAMDRRGFNPLRDTIRGWLDSGESVENLLMAVRAKPDRWESDSGFTVGLRCRNVASLAKALAKERTRRENESSRVDDLGRMQHGFTMSEHDFFYGPGGKR